MEFNLDAVTKWLFPITTVIVVLQSLHVGEKTFLMMSTLLRAFPAEWKDKEASHGEVCEHMPGDHADMRAHLADMVICHLPSHRSAWNEYYFITLTAHTYI